LNHRVLVLGGYGNFGRPICRALAQDANISLLIAGRNEARAAAFADSLGPNRATAIYIDAQAADLSEHLASLAVGTVIHAAGPFQGQDYAVAQACIAAACNYLDLADGRKFVAGISSLDSRARAAGVLVTSGASSVPALSAAVVDHFLSEFGELHEIRHGISSGAKTPGLATMQAVLGYCGKPFDRLEEGAWVTTWGWQDLHRHQYAAPVSGRWLGSCDIPDLELFPQRYPGVRSVVFHAGVGNPASHLATWGLAGLVRKGLVENLAPLAPSLKRLSEWLEPIGTKLSAMHVELRGTGRDGQARQRNWQLIAYDNHGPQIPCGAAIALARKLAAGRLPAKGAMPCVGLLTLEEYLGALAHLNLKQVMQ
jgi:saccharopine dehydrogenase-like NADP-dependent oxidoreductase